LDHPSGGPESAAAGVGVGGPAVARQGGGQPGLDQRDGSPGRRPGLRLGSGQRVVRGGPRLCTGPRRRCSGRCPPGCWRPGSRWRRPPHGQRTVPGSGDGRVSASGCRAQPLRSARPGGRPPVDGQSATMLAITDRAETSPYRDPSHPPTGGVIPPAAVPRGQPRHPLRSGHHRIQHPADIGSEQPAPNPQSPRRSNPQDLWPL